MEMSEKGNESRQSAPRLSSCSQASVSPGPLRLVLAATVLLLAQSVTFTPCNVTITSRSGSIPLAVKSNVIIVYAEAAFSVRLSDGGFGTSAVTFPEDPLSGESYPLSKSDNWASATITKTADLRYCGGVIINDDFWMMPYNYSAGLVKVNTATGVMTRYALDSSISGTGNVLFLSCVYDGVYLWMVPFNGKAVFRVVPGTGGMAYSASWPHVSTLGGYIGASYGNSLVWMTPLNHGYVTRITQGGSMTGYTNWPTSFTWAAKCVYGGRFDSTYHWMFPHRQKWVIGIDVFFPTSTMKGIDGSGWSGVSWASTSNFNGGQNIGSNTLILIPCQANAYVQLDTGTSVAQSFSNFPTGFNPTFGTDCLFSGGLYDGKYIWSAPCEGHSMVIRFDTLGSGAIFGVASSQDFPSGFSGGFAQFRGLSFHPATRTVWFVPYQANQIVVMNTVETPTATATLAATPTATDSGATLTASNSSTPTASVTPAPTPSATSSGATSTATPTASHVPTPTDSKQLTRTTGTPTLSLVPTPSFSSSSTATSTSTGTGVPTPSFAKTPTASPPATDTLTRTLKSPTVRATATGLETMTASHAPTRSASRKITRTTGTPTHSDPETSTPSISRVASMSPTSSQPVPGTRSTTWSVTPTDDTSRTHSGETLTTSLVPTPSAGPTTTATQYNRGPPQQLEPPPPPPPPPPQRTATMTKDTTASWSHVTSLTPSIATTVTSSLMVVTSSLMVVPRATTVTLIPPTPVPVMISCNASSAMGPPTQLALSDQELATPSSNAMTFLLFFDAPSSPWLTLPHSSPSEVARRANYTLRLRQTEDELPNPSGFSFAFSVGTTANLTQVNDTLFELSLSTATGYRIDVDEVIDILLEPQYFEDTGASCLPKGDLLIATLSISATPNEAAVVTKDTAAVVTAVATVTSIMGSSGVALDAQSLAVIGLLTCAQPGDRQSLKNNRLLSPLATDNTYEGMIFGNWILLTMVTVLHVTAVAGFKCWKDATWKDAAGFARFPSWTLAIVFVQHQGTGAAAVKILQSPSSGPLSLALGGITITATVLLPPLCLLLVCWVIDATFNEYEWVKTSSRGEHNNNNDQPEPPEIPNWATLLLPRGKWMPLQTRWKFGSLFAVVGRYEKIWSTLPSWSPCIIIISLMIRPTTQAGCTALFSTMCALEFIIAGIILALRPLRSHVTNVLTASSNICLGFVIMGLAIQSQDPTNVASATFTRRGVQAQISVTVARLMWQVAQFSIEQCVLTKLPLIPRGAWISWRSSRSNRRRTATNHSSLGVVGDVDDLDITIAELNELHLLNPAIDHDETSSSSAGSAPQLRPSQSTTVDPRPVSPVAPPDFDAPPLPNRQRPSVSFAHAPESNRREAFDDIYIDPELVRAAKRQERMAQRRRDEDAAATAVHSALLQTQGDALDFLDSGLNDAVSFLNLPPPAARPLPPPPATAVGSSHQQEQQLLDDLLSEDDNPDLLSLSDLSLGALAGAPTQSAVAMEEEEEDENERERRLLMEETL